MVLSLSYRKRPKGLKELKMSIYISNTLSLKMINNTDISKVVFESITLEEAKKYAAVATSLVGHTEVAECYSNILECSVPFSRLSLVLKSGDNLIVGELKGPHMQERFKTTLNGSSIEWVKVSIQPDFSWDDIRLTEDDGDMGDILYLWEQYGPIPIKWLVDQIKSIVGCKFQRDLFSLMIESVPSLSDGETIYILQGEEWLEVSNQRIIGTNTVSADKLITKYL